MNTPATVKIGYLIPEFPGQTHIFYWRERAALKQYGIDLDIVSTRQPNANLVSHTWAADAQQLTTYLFPPDAAAIAGEVLRAGPVGWTRVLQAIAAADVPAAQRGRLLALAGIGAQLSALARARDWQHLHVHSCADAAHVALFANRWSGLPYSLTLHGPALDVYGPNQRQKWGFARFGFVVSQVLGQEVRDRLGDSTTLPPVAFAPMGVNVEEVQRQTPYEPWRGEGPCRLFSCGRLNAVKGHKDLLAAVSQLVAAGFDIQLEIAGEDDKGGSGYRHEIEAEIASRALGDRVTLLGAVAENRILAGLERAHVFTLASLNEGISVALMEAMAMGVPVVTTRVGGTPELIDSGKDGLLLPPEQPQQFAAEVARVLESPELAQQLSRAARDKVVTQFHHRRSAELLASSLQTAFAESR